ncbi:MAG: phosphoglucosamine mutase [Ilumatobacter sp.]
MKFGTDGVRGVAHKELTTEFAARLARAASRVLGSDGCTAVVIGGDTRESTPSFEHALAAGFTAEGVDAVRLGVVPTPLVAFEAQRRGAMGAMVSASHNPWQDNGIKLFAPGGTKLSDEVEARIEAELETLETLETAESDDSGGDSTAEAERALDRYVEHVVGTLGGRSLDGTTVVLDVANGAAVGVAPDALRRAGAKVIVVADAPDGRNINDGCGAMHPEFVAAAVIDRGADVGIALDGDADRLIAVDNRGRVVDGDHLLAICAMDMRERGLLVADTAVVTVMTNLGFRRAMAEAGINVVETGVGDRYVLEALGAGGYALGGEQSGHVIFTDHATTGDGLLTALSLLDAVARDGRSLAEVADTAMTSLPQVLVNVRVAERVPDIADRMAADVAEVELALGASGRVLLRASGTEPLIRVMVEAATEELAQSSADRLADVARSRFT